MKEKRDPVKQIMSQVHKDARTGKVDLAGHGGFLAEVKRRLSAAGLSEAEMPKMQPKASTKASRTSEGPRLQ